LQRELFRTAFTGFGYDEEAVRGNIRHEVFGGVLAAMYVAAWATRLRPLTSTAQRVVFNASFGLGVLLIIVSMSRSVMLAALAWPLLSFLRSVVTFRLSGRQVALAFGAVAAVLLAVFSGFASVLYVRFTQDTSSYEARDDLLQLAYSNIADNFWTGGVETAGASSHNFILDTWLRSGVFGAVAATAIVVVLVGLWASLIARIGVEPAWMVPVTAALALPIVRLVTAGGGLIPPIQWVLLGFVAGAMAYRQAIGSASDTAPDQIEDVGARAVRG
jgi:O-antigen ligase